MWGDKDKPDPMLLGSHFGHHIIPGGLHHSHHLYGQLHPFSMPGSSKQTTGRPVVLWKGDTARKKRFEPFCSPIVPHVPIRERLARRGTSADVNDDVMPNGYAYSMAGGYPRRRRMSLLQTLRQQNKALADSGLEIRQRTDSENTSSPPQKNSPPLSPSKKGLSSLKTKLFGKKDKRSTAVTSNGECSQSCDLIQGKSRKSPSTTNDSGHGSQGHLEDKMEAMAIAEDDDEEAPERMSRGKLRRMRTGSCPDLSQMRSLSSPRRAPLVDSESDEERQYQMSDRMERNSSPITAADILLERRLIRKQMEAEQRHKYAAANCAM